MKILFDYLWQYQQLRKFDTVIQKISETSFSTQDSADSTKRLARMDVVAESKVLNWFYCFAPAGPATFTVGYFALLAQGKGCLSTLTAACKAKVDSWGPDVVESVYPCSPLQRRILLSQEDDAECVISGMWKVSPANRGSPVDLGRRQNAWRRSVQYHQALRTAFHECGRNDGGITPKLSSERRQQQLNLRWKAEDMMVLMPSSLSTHRPCVEAMRQLGGTHGVSISNFCQGTWAFVLRAFTGSEDVCFGYLASGRDVSVDRIDEIFGPLISMLVLSFLINTSHWPTNISLADTTGDLVSYCSEGKSKRFTFLRREDTRVKARGQRIELDEMYERITRNPADNDPEAGPESAHSPVEQIIS
ncbi:uncharacterized protein FFB14_15177 [Fusarium fujikuroi]|nr:uncharacterized protein FFB14_15177 [Fusarium fujikuroi]